MTDMKISGVDNAILAAEMIHHEGIDNVMISLGGLGAVYCGKSGSAVISVPKITPISTVGAGDSTLAGFVSAFCQSHNIESCLRRACALGTAACLTEGTVPPRKTDIDNIEKMIDVKFC